MNTLISNNTDVKYEFGKWAELRALKIISKKFDVTEMNPSVCKYSPIDGIILNDNKLTPIQIKTRSPRALYGDISLPFSQWETYQDIAVKNGRYICFMICDMYNPHHNLDYKLYSFDVSTVKFTVGDFNNNNSRKSVFIKLRDMIDHGELDVMFQQELEQKHISMIRPTIDKKWLNLYHNKFGKSKKMSYI